MQLAKVLGQVVSTVKEPGLGRFTLLVVRRVSSSDPAKAEGSSTVAVDVVGAGVGEIVLVSSGGAARVAAGADVPTDLAVVAIADTVVDSGEVTFRK